MKVDVFIAGVQKGGTTSTARQLGSVPGVFIPPRELHFFDRTDFNADYSSYHDSYREAVGLLKGDKTPSYCYLAFAMHRIREYNPEARLIILLREPVSRAFSQWNMAVQTGHTTLDFIPSIRSVQSIRLEDIRENGYFALQRGFYIDQINLAVSLFGRSNLHIAISEAILANPEREYQRMFAFLGLTTLSGRLDFDPGIHRRTYSRALTREEFMYLYEIYKPYNRRLYEYLGGEISEWEAIYRNY